MNGKDTLPPLLPSPFPRRASHMYIYPTPHRDMEIKSKRTATTTFVVSCKKQLACIIYNVMLFGQFVVVVVAIVIVIALINK